MAESWQRKHEICSMGLRELLAFGEGSLLERMHTFALERGYAKYTATQVEAWRQSIAGLSDALIMALADSDAPRELGPDDDFINDPVAAFGVKEAQLHRRRGITLEMFLGLMKYYRQAYLDLVSDADYPAAVAANHALALNRLFDRIEIAFCAEWVRSAEAHEELAELQQANRELANEKAQYLTIFESLPNPAIFFAADGKVGKINQAAQEVLLGGVSSTRRSYAEAGDEGGLAKLRPLLEKFRVEGGDSNSGNVSLQVSGQEKVYAVKMEEMKDFSEKFAGTVMILNDISDLHKVARSLQKSRAETAKNHEELKALFLMVQQGKMEWERTMDCIGDMVILTDNEGRIRRCNTALQEFAGQECRKLIGQDWKDILFESGLQAGQFFQPGSELFHPPSNRWYLYNSYPYSDSSGYDISGVVITLHDTTELKQVAEALGSAFNELKATQAKVLQQEKMASIGQLAAGVAHEINNPIGFVASNLGTLDKYVGRLADFITSQDRVLAGVAAGEAVTGLAEERKKLKLDYIMEDARMLIKESQDGTDRVKKIVADLKSFSRVDEAEFKVADINECLESTINIVWNEIKYKATLDKELGDIPPIRCYPQQLNQVFLNLLVNAAHAIEKQGEIKVRTWEDSGQVCISVTDTGSGINEATLAHIFEPFFTTKEVGKGTGLGLSISYDIVKKHQGEILVKSEVGKGTTFIVRIPKGEEQ